MSTDTKQKMDDICNFVKDAFCVDGSVEIIDKPVAFDCAVKCIDKERGVMYVCFNSNPVFLKKMPPKRKQKKQP